MIASLDMGNKILYNMINIMKTSKHRDMKKQKQIYT